MTSTSASITVRVLKYDGSEYRRWNARLKKRAGSLLVLDAEFEHDVEHDLLGSIRRGTKTVEYYWLDRWYNVFRFLDEDGGTRVWYCNINTPPRLEDTLLTYVDLDIDVLVKSNFSYEVLDLDDFELNATKYGYPKSVKEHGHAALSELIGMIKSRHFPFVSKTVKASMSSVVNG